MKTAYTSPATYHSRTNVVNVHAKPLRHKLMAEITKDDVHAVLWPGGKGSRKRGSATRTKVRAVLHLIFITALREGYIQRNPVELLAPERETRVKEMRALSQEQLAAFFKAAAGHKWEAFFRLALATGGRPGELLALQWDDIDFARNAVTFRASIGAESADSPRRVRKAMKTRAAKRTVGVPREALEILEARWQRQRKPKTGLVFAAKSRLDGSPSPVGLRNLNRVLARICENKDCMKAGLAGTTLYDFRHTYASHMIMRGEDVLTVAQCLGHTNSKMLLDTYGHVLDRMKKRAAETAATILRGALNGETADQEYVFPSIYGGTKRAG